MSEKGKIIEWLNNNCDDKDNVLWVLFSKDKRLSWIFGCCKVRLSEYHLLVDLETDNREYFDFSEFSEFQNYVISENEKRDKESFLYRLLEI